MDKAQDVADWAVDRVAAILNAESDEHEWDRDDVQHVPAAHAFARYIEAHEQPPVDPLHEALQATLDRMGLVDPAWDGAPAEASAFAAVLVAELAKRGLALAGRGEGVDG